MSAGRVLISNIGENGFLIRSIEEIAADSREMGAETPTAPLLVEALKRLQTHLEPPGMAARTLSESLVLQLNAHEKNEDAIAGDTRFADARLLVENDLRDLESNRLAAIRQRHGWTSERLDIARDCLRHCNPAPGRSLKVERAPIVRPDVIIEYDTATDAYSARLASGVLPNLQVSEEYLRLSKAKKTDDATKLMLNDGIRRARWFIDAIEQRGATLLRVVNEVIANQRDWLDSGGGSLKPLPMTQVAKKLGMNVSTISRTVAGKWIVTPRGSFELRKLFAGGTETESGSDISWVAVKAIVGEIIAAEEKSKPLSDQAISLALKERGIPLARRTVVKYREQLGIPSARVRRVGEAS
jgi:RNA polymerase sigma-54 factor